MRKFNLEEAKVGKPVCTRDGRKTRIVCYDLKVIDTPILALIEESGQEKVYCYHSNGKYYKEKDTDNDLFMASEHHIGWVNIYETSDGDKVVIGPYETEKEAVHMKFGDDEVVTTKIEWDN